MNPCQKRPLPLLPTVSLPICREKKNRSKFAIVKKKQNLQPEKKTSPSPSTSLSLQPVMLCSVQAIEGFGGVPPIRPLETLHNALSLRQLDNFLEKMTTGPLFKTPASSPPKYPSTPLPTPVPSPATIPDTATLAQASKCP